MNDDRSRQARTGFARHLRVGLQLKSVLILTLVVVSVTVAGGWFYFDTCKAYLRKSDHRYATWMVQTLSVAARGDLAENRDNALQRLAGDFLSNNNVRYVAILDRQGRVVSWACHSAYSGKWDALARMPVTVSTTYQGSDYELMVARPVLASSAAGKDDTVVGAVRMVLDTTSTAESLVRVQQRMGIIAAAIVLGALPLGFMLVWRAVLQPVRRLVKVTRQLAGGDYDQRAALRRNDEIGELSTAFDTMADKIASQRDELIGANERLEHKVAQRTDELQRTNLRLRDEMAEKEDFLRAVSHDLNAPLRNIAGMATLIMMKWQQELPEEVVGRLQRIQANADAESSLIGELLELSRIKTRPQKRQVVDVGEVLHSLAETFDYELKSRNIALRIASDMPRLYVEKNRVRQVFQNLIDNAIKYMNRPVGGWIDVSYRFADGQHVFAVSDNGPGIAPEEHQKMFYVFRRAESPEVAKVQGKGVGLALVKSVMANYEGRAWVQSEPLKGATFFVSFSGHCTQLPQSVGEADAEASETENVPEDCHLVG